MPRTFPAFADVDRFFNRIANGWPFAWPADQAEREQRAAGRRGQPPRLRMGVAVMNAWVLSAILCSATPSPAGDYCQAVALRYGVTREICHAELEKWRDHASKPRLECTEDAGLVAFLAEQEGDGQLELDESDGDGRDR